MINPIKTRYIQINSGIVYIVPYKYNCKLYLYGADSPFGKCSEKLLKRKSRNYYPISAIGIMTSSLFSGGQEEGNYPTCVQQAHGSPEALASWACARCSIIILQKLLGLCAAWVALGRAPRPNDWCPINFRLWRDDEHRGALWEVVGSTRL